MKVGSESLLEECQTLQNFLVDYSTGGGDADFDYEAVRRKLNANESIRHLIPEFVRTCRTIGQFWGFIKAKFPTYAERRTYLWGEFQPLLDHLEGQNKAPGDELVTSFLKNLDQSSIHTVWQTALERRVNDPEGAITSARTLLETVCKNILDDLSTPFSSRDDLTKLYGLTAQALNIAPSQHTQDVFKQILGGCTAVVGGLGALRNRLGDAHGQGRHPVKPAPRHAELAVNLAGAVCLFLVQTWKAQTESVKVNDRQTL